MSECHERLGQLFEALAACPTEQPERLARLGGMCQPGVDALVERQEFIEAARQAQGLVRNLDRAAQATAAVIAGRAEAASLRAGVVTTGRQHFNYLAQQAAVGERSAAYDAWSRFEEE
jgi:molecular chaperone DnaK